jgi:hypothetical protein
MWALGFRHGVRQLSKAFFVYVNAGRKIPFGRRAPKRHNSHGETPYATG